MRRKKVEQPAKKPAPKKEEQPTATTTPSTTKGAETSSVDCSQVPCVALTYDDGPSVYTNGLLDILKDENVKATFLVLGKSAKVQTNIILRQQREGHEIANHSWNHKDLASWELAKCLTKLTKPMRL